MMSILQKPLSPVFPLHFDEIHFFFILVKEKAFCAITSKSPCQSSLGSCEKNHSVEIYWFIRYDNVS